MAIYNDYTKETTFTGAVFGEKEHFWADGMLSVYSLVWDKEGMKSNQSKLVILPLQDRIKLDALQKLTLTRIQQGILSELTK